LDNDEIIASLDRELPEYLAATDGVSMSSEYEMLALWAANSKTLPNWSALVQKLLRALATELSFCRKSLQPIKQCIQRPARFLTYGLS
jgi:hypothetical protein